CARDACGVWVVKLFKGITRGRWNVRQPNAYDGCLEIGESFFGGEATYFGAKPSLHPRSGDREYASSLLERLQHDGFVERLDRTQIDDFGVDVLGCQHRRGLCG